MQLILGWILIIFPGTMFLIQVISSVNFSLAQKPGLQEKPETADSLLIRSERNTAYWDILTLIWLPIGGILMVVNHPWWPLISLIGALFILIPQEEKRQKILAFVSKVSSLALRKNKNYFLLLILPWQF